MNPIASPEWFIEGPEGKRFGPYTIAQLSEWAKQGKVPLGARVTANHLNGKTISLQEALAGDGPRPAQSQSGIPNILPPRPKFNPKTESQSRAQDRHDPADSLFEALQSVKDRKTVKIEPLAPAESKSSQNRILTPVLLLGAVAIAGVVFFARRTNQQLSAISNSSPPGTVPSTSVSATSALAHASPRPSVSPHNIITFPTKKPAIDLAKEREKQKERERELERERERARDRERDRRDDDRDRERDRDRDAHESDRNSTDHDKEHDQENHEKDDFHDTRNTDGANHEAPPQNP